MSFSEKLRAAQRATGSRLCVGIDPDLPRLPEPLHDLRDRDPGAAVVQFAQAIMDRTADLACAYKLNLAFFESLGSAGWEAFEEVAAAIPSDRVLIADAKRGDIGNTARQYARAFYEHADADAVTVSPYMGTDAIVPFVEAKGRCAFVLIATSNASGSQIQDLLVDGIPVYHHVARLSVDAGLDEDGEIGFVVGATRPALLADLREAYPDVPFLIPGVGAQGGDPAEVVAACGSGPILVTSSRSILYASSGDDFAEAARSSAESLRAALGRPTV